MIKMIRSNKLKLILGIHLLIQMACVIMGFLFKSNDNVVPSTLLEIVTKVQTTNSFQNFVWCFTNNFAILFIVFWVNYWTWGIVGTIWSSSSAFVLGSVIKVSMTLNLWIVPIFISLELIASIIILISSTYYRLEKNIEKGKRQKGIIITLTVVSLILLIAAILETIVLNSMQ